MDTLYLCSFIGAGLLGILATWAKYTGDTIKADQKSKLEAAYKEAQDHNQKEAQRLAEVRHLEQIAVIATEKQNQDLKLELAQKAAAMKQPVQTDSPLLAPIPGLQEAIQAGLRGVPAATVAEMHRQAEEMVKHAKLRREADKVDQIARPLVQHLLNVIYRAIAEADAAGLVVVEKETDGELPPVLVEYRQAGAFVGVTKKIAKTFLFKGGFRWHVVVTPGFYLIPPVIDVPDVASINIEIIDTTENPDRICYFVRFADLQSATPELMTFSNHSLIPSGNRTETRAALAKLKNDYQTKLITADEVVAKSVVAALQESIVIQSTRPAKKQ